MNLKTEKTNNTLPDTELINSIADALNLNHKLVELLILRGYDSVEAVKSFLHPSLESFYSPDTMLGMEECCDRIKQAIENKEKVVIYGDYDADGICAASIFSLYLSSCGLDVHTHIPDRVGEGYGLHVDSIERIIEDVMPDLILTCDCGISGIEEVELAKDLGVDIIVTDHHEVGEVRPDCVIVNPHQSECKYPFKELCGAGVVLKIVQALGGIEEASKYFDLAAIATVADLVSLTDENRLIVQLGLQKMPTSKNLGILALLKKLDLKVVTSSDIAYKIAPRINAAGRMGSAFRAFELFTSSDQSIVDSILAEILEANDKRKTLSDKLYDQAIEILHKEDLINNRAIVIVGDDWEKGITGIIAARLVNDFKRPVFILVKNEDDYKGTCRSIDGVNVYELLSKNAELLNEFGGHNQAAGFSISAQNIKQFKKNICDALNDYDDSLFIPTLKYDMELEESDITKEFAASLDLIEPTGNNGNPKPLFMTKTKSLSAVPLKTNINHTILKTENGLQFFAFNSYSLNAYYNGAAPREMIFELSNNDFAPRLYLRGCAPEKLYINDSLAKACFLKMLNYQSNEPPKYSIYSAENLGKLIDNNLGILLIAGSKAAYECVASAAYPNVVMYELFVESDVNIYTRLIISPELGKTFMLENYRKVIFIDTPPSLSVVGYINRRTAAEVYLPEVDNRKDVLSCVKAGRELFGRYFKALKTNAGIREPNINAFYKTLFTRDKTIEFPQFIACLSVFTQLKLLCFKPNVGIVLNANPNAALEQSSIYKEIEAWQNE